jgi:energy-coupling factor transporter ATP-binding protein EcfA2
LRGTHGSGKSTLVRSLVYAHPHARLGQGRRPDGYRLEVSGLDRPVFVVGQYETTCGGCDGIQPYSLIWPRVEQYAADGHVLFEGALVSSSYGNIGRASEAYGDRFVFAFMGTPLEECLRRVAARRAARGDARPLDPKNTTVKYENVQRSLPKIRDELGRRVVVLKPGSELAQIMLLLREDEQCP